jgi:hypothetical protein
MKVGLLFIALSLLIEGVAQPFPIFKTLRYNENYAFLKDDTSNLWYHKIKYVPIADKGSTYLSFGGELRYQYFNIRNEDWKDVPKDDYLFSRFLLHSDLHIKNSVRLFVQFQSSMANGKISGNSAVDENTFDLHQAFIDVNSKDRKAILRLGRQELSYGSQRLLSVRELPNNRQSFDAIRGLFSFRNSSADVFLSRYVTARKGIFDDLSNKELHLWGLYIVHEKVPLLKNIDLYYLGMRKSKAAYHDGFGKELRHSLGTRIWDNNPIWKYDFEGLYQFGDFAGKTITAWTLSTNTTYQFSNLVFQPELGLKAELISGDRQKGDGKLQTFNPLFPKGAYFGLAALIGPSNLFDIHPSLALELVKTKLVWTTDYAAFWRKSKNDGIYATNISLIYPSGNSPHQFIGHQLATEFTFTPNPFALFRFEATHFTTGSYLKDVSSGKNLLFWGITSQLKF